MRRTMALKVLPAVGAGLLMALALPGLASADTLDAYNNGVLPGIRSASTPSGSSSPRWS